MSVLRNVAGRSLGRMSGSYFVSFVWTLRKYDHALSTSAGFAMMSRIVAAIAFAPAVAPLCAMGVADAIALDQWWPGSPGMFEGYRSVTVGTFHETSPMSSDPPPMFRPSGSGAIVLSSLDGMPSSREPISFCTAFAIVWSASLHFGRPTCLMFANIASAIGLLKCCGHAEPITWLRTSFVPVMIAAPAAMESPVAHIVLICGYVSSRK